MSVVEKENFDKWVLNYFGKYDAFQIRQLEKNGEKNPEVSWCVAMVFRYINLLRGMDETKALQELNGILREVVEFKDPDHSLESGQK